MKFDNLRETFFLAEGTHVGEVISADRDMIVINVVGKLGAYQCPVPAPRVSHAYPDIEQPVGEIPDITGRIWPLPDEENQRNDRAAGYEKARELHPELNVHESITLAEYLLTGRTD